MPWVLVKCTSCGGDIQLDDQRDSGLCLYCGSKVEYKEALLKMELSGSVSVNGIASKEKLLKNAETFSQLGDDRKAREILNQITNYYPEDYRAWWSLFLDETNNMDKNRIYSSENGTVSRYAINIARKAIIVAPEGKKNELQLLLSSWETLVNEKESAGRAAYEAKRKFEKAQEEAQKDEQRRLDEERKIKDKIETWLIRSILVVLNVVAFISVFGSDGSYTSIPVKIVIILCWLFILGPITILVIGPMFDDY